MNTCTCGMTLDHPSSGARCPECGTSICRSCSIELDATNYCRWCGTSAGHAAAVRAA